MNVAANVKYKRAIEKMNNPFASAGLPKDAEDQLRSFFEQTSTLMINENEPVSSNSGEPRLPGTRT
jgi:hypothetical protein